MGRRATAWLLALVLPLAGCWDRTEIEDTAYVVSLGIDAVAPNECRWTFRIVEAEELPVGMLTAQGVLGDGLASKLISVRACTLEQAVQLAQAGLVRILSLVQLREVVFGEALARRGLGRELSHLLRHGEVRLAAGVHVARGRAVDIFIHNQPIGDVNPVKFMEGLLLVQKRMHLSPPIRLQHFNGRLMAPGVDPILPLIAVNPNATSTPGSPLPPMGQEKSLRAGEFPRTGGNPVEVAGAAVFRGDRMVGTLNVDQTAALLALRGEMGKVYATLPSPSVPGDVITMRYHQENKPQYRARWSGGRPAVGVRLQFEGEVLSAPPATNPASPPERRALEQYIARYGREHFYAPLIRQVYGEWGADPVGFGQLFRSRFPTFDAWLSYDWPDRVRDLQVTVETELFIRRYGMILDTQSRQEEE